LRNALKPQNQAVPAYYYLLHSLENFTIGRRSPRGCQIGSDLTSDFPVENKHRFNQRTSIAATNIRQLQKASSDYDNQRARPNLWPEGFNLNRATKSQLPTTINSAAGRDNLPVSRA
jgi:hypothetical protein